jgi:hypothetical protein
MHKVYVNFTSGSSPNAELWFDIVPRIGEEIVYHHERYTVFEIQHYPSQDHQIPADVYVSARLYIHA